MNEYLCTHFNKLRFIAEERKTWPDFYCHTPEEAAQKWAGTRYQPSSYHWESHDIDLSQVLNDKMAAIQIASIRNEIDDKTFEMGSIYKCYNPELKIEFILVSRSLSHKIEYYDPDYGRNDNYSSTKRFDNEYLAFSVEAFKRLRPEWAACLESS